MSTESTPNTYTPDTDRQAALHWAAHAVILRDSREAAGNSPLAPVEQANYDRYLAAAYGHGITDKEIRAYAAILAADEG